MFKEIKEFVKDNLSKTPSELQKEIKEKFSVDMTTKQIADRLYYYRNLINSTYGIISDNPSKTHTVSSDSNGITSTNIKVSSTSLSPSSLLSAHGLDPNEFDLVRVWYKESGNGDFLSSIFAKPKIKGIKLSDIVSSFTKNVKPTPFVYSKKGENNYLINFADIHFGITKLSDVQGTLNNIGSYFKNKNPNKICINLLGDEFHSAQITEAITLSGTVLEDINMIDAIETAKIFYESLFHILNGKTKSIELFRTPGNHDGNISYLFTEYLKVRFPNILINNTNNFRTYYKLGKVGVMLTHGHLGKKQEYINLFASEGRNIFSTTNTNIILTGHRHQELVEQTAAATIYQVGTCKPLDKWSDNNCFIKDTRTRNWQIMELDDNEIIGYQYI